MAAPGRSVVLVVDDDPSMRDLLEQGLASDTRAVETAASGPAALERVVKGGVDVVVTDLRMPGVTGLELCARILERTSDVPVIVLTAFGDYEAAVQAVRAGAYDFISKPVRLDVLALAVDRALAHGGLRREVRRLESSLARTATSETLIGESEAMKNVRDLVARLSDSDSTVLVTGESGTGKELVARALHEHGPRSSGPFVAVNCAAVPENLLEAELFGHEKGAFTDAKASRAGLFVEANRGTLFLDEIGELPASLQPKLLRALQERTVRPVGGRKELPFDVRLVTATNRDLELLVEEGRFRQDLYFRVNVIELPLPPLRARGNDVLVLAQHFTGMFAGRARKNVVGITPEAAALLAAYDWPGNVRELSNAVERAVALTTHDHLTAFDLPERVVRRAATAATAPADPTEFSTLDEMERRYILQVLEFVGGSRAAAARILGLDRTTLWRRLERYGVSKSKPPPE